MPRRLSRIRGEVAPDGVSATETWGGRPDRRRVTVVLRPWREGDGPVRHDRLPIWAYSRLPLIVWRRLLPRRGVVEMLAELGDQEPLRAQMVGWPRRVRDVELIGAQSDWLKSRRLHDPLLGELTYDERLDWFETDLPWCGRKVRLSFGAVDEAAGKEALAQVHQLLGDQERVNRRIQDAMVAEMLPLWNENWRDVDQAELSREAFLQAVRLESMTVDEDYAAFYFNDGGLFGHHTIEVSWQQDTDEWDVGLSG